MLKESTIVKLSQNTLKRYEHNLENGVLFLYNLETEEVWTGNSSSNNLIKFMDGRRTLKEIYLILQPLFEDYEYNVLKKSFDSLISSLLEKNFLEIIKG